MRQNQQANEKLTREILRENHLELKVDSLVLEENFAEGTSSVRVNLAPVSLPTLKMERRVVQGRGVGLVDAFFRGLVDQFSSEYPSLRSIRFVGFGLRGVLDKDRPREAAGSDAVAEVQLLVENSEGSEFEFVASSRSITASALQATLDAVEYFVNSERAFLITHAAVNDATSRGRPDLAETFAARLARLVQNTSYSEAIEAARKTR